jgi:hypothetical protein
MRFLIMHKKCPARSGANLKDQRVRHTLATLKRQRKNFDEARRRRATFARHITEMELADRRVHRGVGALTRSYFRESGR